MYILYISLLISPYLISIKPTIIVTRLYLNRFIEWTLCCWISSCLLSPPLQKVGGQVPPQTFTLKHSHTHTHTYSYYLLIILLSLQNIPYTTLKSYMT